MKYICKLLIFSLLGLIGSCTTIELEKPIINASNSSNPKLNQYYYLIDGENINLMEVIDLSKYNADVGNLYTCITPTENSGGNDFLRFYNRVHPNQYVCQIASKTNQNSAMFNLCIVEKISSGDLIFYNLDNLKLKKEISNSKYFTNLQNHIAWKNDHTVGFDSTICQNFGDRILNFFKQVELNNIISDEDERGFVFKKADEELYNYFLKKYISESTQKYILEHESGN